LVVSAFCCSIINTQGFGQAAAVGKTKKQRFKKHGRQRRIPVFVVKK